MRVPCFRLLRPSALFVFFLLPLWLFGQVGPQRIISTAPSNTDIIADLGAADRLIAVDPYSALIPGVPKGLPHIDFASPDAEALINMQPDLIIASSINRLNSSDNPFKPLQDLGIKVDYIEIPVAIADIYTVINQIAGDLGLPEKGRSLVSRMKGQLAAIKAVSSGIKNKKTVYYEVSGVPLPVTTGSGTYLDEMLDIAGLKNIFEPKKGWFSPNGEAVISANPDVILSNDALTQGGMVTALADFKSRPGFSSISAVKNGKIYFMNGDNASRPSPGIVKAILEIARTVYPDFPWPNV
jgi:iron complex transport system substrate-binding protein